MTTQNIYDNDEFYKGYITLPRQVLGLDGAPEWPTIKAMLPDLTGKRVLDMGCGFGWFARYARENGAASALGLDVSENMIAKAKEDTSDPVVDYELTDLNTFDLPEGSFDFAYSALAFHYIEDFPRLVRTVHKALTAGSSFVFEIEHPVFTAPTKPWWPEDEAGKKSWAVNSYSVEGERRRDWFTKGVLKYHRTMATTLNALTSAGFAIRRIEEFSPSPQAVEADPYLASEVDRPMFLIVSAER